MARQSSKAERRSFVLVLGEEEACAPSVESLASGSLHCVRGRIEEARALARERAWDAALLAHPDRHAVLEAVQALRAAGAFPIVYVGATDTVSERACAVAASSSGEAATLVAELLARAGPSWRMQALCGAAEAAIGGHNPSDRLHHALVRLAPALPADRCSIILVEAERLPLVVATSEMPGFRRPLALERYPEVREALDSRQPVYVRDALSDPRFDAVRPHIAACGVRSVLAVPLLEGAKAIGVLLARRKGRPEAYGREAADLALAAAGVLGAAVGAARRERAIEQRHEEIQAAWEGRICDLERANQRLRAVHRFKDETVAVLAHDLRGPLNIILGHAKLLEEADPEALDRSSVEAILRQAKKIQSLSDSLVAQGRGDATCRVLHLSQMDLAKACRELAGEHEILATSRGISIEVAAPPRICLLADAPKVRQILQSLFELALERAREGGHVRIEAVALPRPKGGHARVSVTYDGPGLSPEVGIALFERYRVGPVSSTPSLAACRELVELHGGDIWAESGAPGSCAFRFILPGVGACLPHEALHALAERPRILLVEHEPLKAAVTADVLRRYRIDVVRDGDEALSSARALCPDLVVMDALPPYVDGLGVATALRAAPDTRDIPILFISSDPEVEGQVRAFHGGAVGFLAEPFDVSTLLDRVEAALQQREMPRAQARS